MTFNSQKIGGIRRRAGSSLDEAGFEEAQATDAARSEYDTHSSTQKLANQLYYIDGSDAYANAGMSIIFQHVPSQTSVAFKAFIMTLNETYSPDWAAESVYGRADPIYMFKNTTRNITIGFRIPAATEGEGFENLAKVQQLVQFLYPNYDYGGKAPSPSRDNALTIAQSPLVRMKIMNLFAKRDQTTTDKLATNGQGTFDAHRAGRAAHGLPGEPGTIDGLLGVIKNFSVNHNLDTPDYGAFELNMGTIVPKLLEVNLDFAVIHESQLGWDSEGNFSNALFPYGANLPGSKPKGYGEVEREIKASANAMSQAAREQREEQTATAIADQFEQNAQARYSGMFEKMRANRDKRKLDETAGTANKWFVRKINNPGTAAEVAGTHMAYDGPSGESANQAELFYTAAGGTGEIDWSEFID